MKLQELLKIDTSKSNWFKIFARNGINVKTLCGLLLNDSANWSTWYFEEAEDIENNYDGLMGCFKELEPSITEEMIYEMCGLKRIPYEEYMALRLDKEKGKDYIN